jgi:catechol 2,3-dioxygenase-like lactoylglutathione lyase family enzyme
VQHVLGVDHCPLLVRDLDAAERTMRRLGFRPTPRGIHSAHMGTANATVPFRDGTYLETVGVLRPTPHNADRRERLAARGEGPFGLAFKTDDARAAAAAFAAAGLGSGEAVDFARPVELPAGTREARFTVARTRPGSTPGAWIFVCQHHTPNVVWREDHLDHPNGTQGILEVVGMAPDLPALARSWGRIFGARLRADARSITIDGPGAATRFLEPGAFRRRYGPVGAAVLAAGEPDLAALRLTVRDLEAVAEVLRRHEVPFHRLEGGTIGVAPEQACGAVLEFSARIAQAR